MYDDKYKLGSTFIDKINTSYSRNVSLCIKEPDCLMSCFSLETD
jgi:hypothetical protein